MHTELEIQEFKSRFEQSSNSILIDVREEYEHEDQNMGGQNIPMGDILSRIDELTSFKNIYLYCRSGKRSKATAYHLKKKLNSCHIYSCAGGIQSLNKIV